MTDEERYAAYELTMTPEQKARHAEYDAMMSAVAEVVREFVGARLKPIETRLATAADASRIVEQDDRLAALSAKLDKVLTTQSSQSKHLQALERKFGELAGRGRAS